MPHIHLEYSDQLQALEMKPLLSRINRTLVENGLLGNASDIKSRAICQQDYVIGLDESAQAYVHAKISILKGRSTALKQEISRTVLEVLQDYLPPQNELTLQLCVEILEMDPDIYSKAIICP